LAGLYALLRNRDAQARLGAFISFCSEQGYAPDDIGDPHLARFVEMLRRGLVGADVLGRDEFGERDPWQTEGGIVTEHVLEALRIPITRLDSPDQVAPRLKKAETLASSANRPVAVLLGRDLMWEEA
jgi:hypothetical protein